LKLGIVVVVVSALVVLIGFEAFQTLSVRSGQIPPRGVHVWAGKPFLHWDAFACQKYGDLIGLSVLNGFVAVSVRHLIVAGRWTAHTSVAAGVVGVIAAIATVLWVVSVQNQFAAGKFNRWDWGFTHPDGALTVAGKFHLGYFALEAAVIGVALLILSWKLPWNELGGLLRAGMLAGLGFWIATAILDARRIGLSGGPFGDPKRFPAAVGEAR